MVIGILRNTNNQLVSLNKERKYKITIQMNKNVSEKS